MDDKSKRYNTIKRCDKINSKNKKLIPHNTNLNNLKTNKYFTYDDNNNCMKKALTQYREKNRNSNNNNNNTSKIHQSNISTTYCSNIYPLKTKVHKNNSFKVDKNIINYAEPRTKVKEFHKIQPKIIDSLIIDNENVDSFFDNDDNENIKINIDINNKLNKKNSNMKSTKNNNNGKSNKNKKYRSEYISIDLYNLDTNDNNDTIINDDIDEESVKNGLEKVNHVNSKANKDIYKKNDNKNIEKEYIITDIDNVNNNISNIMDINETNLEYLLMVEKLYTELIKDIEINKMEIFHNKISITKDFLYIYNIDNSSNLYYIIDKMIINDNNNLNLGNNAYTKSKSCNFNFNISNYNIFLIIKEYLIMQIVFFYTIILIGLIKKDKNNFQSGLHNLAFYFHQNIIVFIYIIFSNVKFNSQENCNGNSESNNYEKCLKILNENKTWLDKNNYKKYMQTNNKLSKQIIINLLTQIKLYFKKNPYNGKPNNFIESSANLIISYLNSFKKRKIINILNEIKKSSSINNLLESIKFNKIISHYNEENNNTKKKDKDNGREDQYNNGDTFNETPKPPFLKPISSKYKYTLVLDLDETLVHYISDNDSAYIQIRPGAEEFIKELSEYYEIIIFTAALQSYADLVLDGIDPDGVISDRLYRQHTMSVGNANIKNLEKIGRNIKHVIIIDNFMENFSLQPKNGLNIVDFEGNEYDEELEYLKEDLIKLVKLNPDDVRCYLKDIQAKMDKRAIHFQKLNNDNNYKEELLNGNIYYEEKNNLFSEIINKDKMSNNDKGNYTDDSENIEEEKS